MWAVFKILFPTYFVFWAFLACFCTGAWYLWTRIYKSYSFKWQAPVLAATFAVGCMYSMAMLSTGQQVAFQAATGNQGSGQVAQQGAPGQQPNAPQQPVDPMLQMKSEFLKSVEAAIQQPNDLTSAEKKKLFDGYSKLFPRGKQDHEIYGKAILDVYECQRNMWEDALASFKAKIAIKSDSRKECENKPGVFFNREKLMTPEMITNADETVKNLAARKRVPASDGKTVEVTEAMVRETLDMQTRQYMRVKQIFDIK